MTKEVPLIREAKEYVASWRNDDSNFPIPVNAFGCDLAFFIDVLLDVADSVIKEVGK